MVYHPIATRMLEGPRIAEALPVGESFLAGDGCVLILGDNIFWGHMDFLRDAVGRPSRATVFGYPVTDPERYGMVQLDADEMAATVRGYPDRAHGAYLEAVLDE